MRTKKELIDSWIKKAAKDLLTVEHELSFWSSKLQLAFLSLRWRYVFGAG